MTLSPQTSTAAANTVSLASSGGDLATEGAAAPLRHEILSTDTEFSDIRAEWQTLVDAVPSAEWSAQPAVFSVWRQQMRPDSGLRIIAVRNAKGDLRGLMPVSLDTAWRGPSLMPRYDYDPRDARLIVNRARRPIPVPQLSPPSSIPATFLWVGPLSRPQDRDAVRFAIARAMADLPGWAVAVLPAEVGPDADRWVEALTNAGLTACSHHLGRMVRNIGTLVPFDDILARHKWKFRQNVRRARKAAVAAGVTFDIHVGRDAVVPLLPEVSRIADLSWKATGRDTVDVHLPYGREQRAYFEQLMADKDTAATPVLGIARDKDGPVTVLLMQRHGNGLTALLTFWDGRLPKTSPGLLLMGEAIDWATRNGVERLDLNATAQWVRHIADSTTELCNVTAFQASWRGRAFAALSGLLTRLRS